MAKAVVDRRAAKTAKPDPMEALAGIEARERQLAEDWAVGKIDRARWDMASAALEKAKTAARAAIAAEVRPRAVASLPADPANLATSWKRLTLDQRRAAIAAVVDRVTVGPGRRGYNKFDSTRVSIIWSR
jgi:hypothetical protein